MRLFLLFFAALVPIVVGVSCVQRQDTSFRTSGFTGADYEFDSGRILQDNFGYWFIRKCHDAECGAVLILQRNSRLYDPDNGIFLIDAVNIEETWRGLRVGDVVVSVEIGQFLVVTHDGNGDWFVAKGFEADLNPWDLGATDFERHDKLRRIWESAVEKEGRTAEFPGLGTLTGLRDLRTAEFPNVSVHSGKRASDSNSGTSRQGDEND
jgi:hypothetical protein